MNESSMDDSVCLKGQTSDFFFFFFANHISNFHHHTDRRSDQINPLGTLTSLLLFLYRKKSSIICVLPRFTHGASPTRQNMLCVVVFFSWKQNPSSNFHSSCHVTVSWDQLEQEESFPMFSLIEAWWWCVSHTVFEEHNFSCQSSVQLKPLYEIKNLNYND